MTIFIATNCNNKALERLFNSLKHSQKRFDKAIRFNEFLSFNPSSISKIAEALQPQLNENRKRQRKAVEAIHFEQRLATVVANALAADDQGRPCRYSRRKSTYSGPSRFYPDHIRSDRLVELIDQMTEAGYLEHSKAEPGTRGKRQSTFRATRLLKYDLNQIGISVDDLQGDAPAAPVIEFRNEQKDRVENTAFLAFLTPQADVIRQHHSQLDAHTFTLGAGRKPIRQFTPLRRIFNNRSPEQGGRFYGGWWQNTRSKLRSTIRIDGQETVELDYSGFMPRALYHSLNINYLDDPYEIPEIYLAADLEGIPRKQIRDGIKKLFLVMINGKDDRIMPGEVTLPKSITRAHAFSLLREKHNPLSQFFHSGITVNLMKNESDICGAILQDGVRDCVPVLPIHDSYIVKLENKQWLEYRMKYHYYNMFRYNAIIK